jgi:hypothetical protein
MNADEIYPESLQEIAEYEAMYKGQRERREKEKEQGASQAPIFYLNKIYSIKKQLQVFDILQAIRPTHEERLWLAGFSNTPAIPAMK